MLCVISGYVVTVYVLWVGVAVMWQLAGFLARWVRIEGRLCAPPCRKKIGGEEVLVATQLNHDTTLPQVARDWYSPRDIATRLSVCCFGFCFRCLRGQRMLE